MAGGDKKQDVKTLLQLKKKTPQKNNQTKKEEGSFFPVPFPN